MFKSVSTSSRSKSMMSVSKSLMVDDNANGFSNDMVSCDHPLAESYVLERMAHVKVVL